MKDEDVAHLHQCALPLQSAPGRELHVRLTRSKVFPYLCGELRLQDDAHAGREAGVTRLTKTPDSDPSVLEETVPFWSLFRSELRVSYFVVLLMALVRTSTSISIPILNNHIGHFSPT